MEQTYAAFDDLTGVYRRGAGMGELRRKVARVWVTAQPLVLAFVDVDRLKLINDLHGHVAGDRMLTKVCRTLRGSLRSSDLIFRFGGDEFICAIAGISKEDAGKRFVDVNALLAAPPGSGSVTVGLAELLPNDTAEDLVGRADAALYRARQRQRPTS